MIDEGKVINQLNKDMFGLDTEFIKRHPTLIKPIMHIVNLSINAGEFPEVFKQRVDTVKHYLLLKSHLQ